jgi:hypothetical protein
VSSAQFASVVVLAHTLAVDVHTELLHVQLADPGEPVQLWLVSVQPVVAQVPVDEHVWSAVPEHCVAFGVQATHPPFRQTGVPPAHAEDDAS